ncbi:hypothetical protein BC834DRAFT_965863 [Gloeopeniophorella convolvens]|nr:hypothetical protein BC834DRAFT_965863 [Gloeopeniophorella convolvens]
MDTLVHDGTFDGQYQPVTADSLVPTLSSADPLTSFPSVVGSPLGDALHPSHQLPSFSDGINPTATLTVPIDLPLSQGPRHMDISPTDVLPTSVHHDSVPPPGAISSFQSQLRDSFSVDAAFDIPRPSQSSPAATSVSSFASHTSSPAIPGLNPAYATIPSASIASTMDSMGLPGRSRSGSAASPGRYMGSGSDLTFPSVSSTGPPTSNHGSGYRFPPSEYDVSPPTEEDASGDLGAPHMMVVDDMLKHIMQTADQARVDCNAGQTANAGVKIDQLKKTISLVSELIAATRLADGPSPPSDNSSPPVASATRASPPHLSRPGVGPPYPPLLPPGDPQSQDSSGLADHESRKRCASSMNEDDRVIKALKMEPPDDVPQHLLSSFPFSSSVGSGPTSIVSSHPVSFLSNPSSRPPSRPTSPPTIPMHAQLNLYQPQLQPPSVPIGFPPPPNLTATNGPSSSDFTPPNSATHPPVAGHVPAFGHAPESWGEHPAPFAPSHRHTLSGNHLNGDVDMKNIILGVPPAFAPQTTVFPSPPSAPLAAPPAATVAPSLLQNRASRSNSLSNPPSGDPFAFGVPLPEATIDERAEYLAGASRPGTGFSRDHSPASSPEYDDEHDSDTGSPGRHYRSRNGSVGDAYSRAPQRRTLASRTSTDNFAANVGSSNGGHSNEVPTEYRPEVDRVFFEFLNKTCSNLDATDGKGEPIHQTLMAKKMQRLDESPDFRPFKFRIQAFTNAFLEELARQGYPEDKIPMKKIRNYLWNSTYISRFNEDGKKAKSKGNHIWNIEAKKTGEGGWTFRPFQRRLAGVPPGVAYVGLRWTWTPRIWDPQASRANMPVTYTSPSLPLWLSWHEDQYLTGIPTPDAQSCDVTVEARFTQDGKEEFLSQTVHINIAPVANVDTSFSSTSRRPSLVGEGSRRIASDSVIPQTSPSRPPPLMRPQTTNLAPPPPQPVPSQDAQLIQVLTAAAQRVAQEAQSQVVAAGAPSEPGHELQALAKQQHVLTVTAQAVDDTVSAQGSAVAQPASVLAAAAQQVVMQAARQVAADHSAIAAAQISAGLPPPPAGPPVTVNEVSVATQAVVAQAVELTGPLSSEVDVLMTASSLLSAQAQVVVQAARPPPAVAGALHQHRASFSALPPPQVQAAVPAPMPPVPLPLPPEGAPGMQPLPVDLAVYSQLS